MIIDNHLAPILEEKKSLGKGSSKSSSKENDDSKQPKSLKAVAHQRQEIK